MGLGLLLRMSQIYATIVKDARKKYSYFSRRRDGPDLERLLLSQNMGISGRSAIALPDSNAVIEPVPTSGGGGLAAAC